MKRFSEKRGTLISVVDLKQKKYRAVYWSFFAVMVLLVLICLVPVLWLILSSFKDMNEFLQVPPTFIPKSFHPEKIWEAWQSMHFGKYYLNTIILAGGSWLMSIVINGLAGYVLSRLKPKGSTMVFTLILWTMMMPTSVSMVPLFMTFIDFPIFHFSLLNTYLPMWLIAGANAFNVLLFKSFFDSIPISYIEAAKLDGCSNLGIFTRIVVPMSKPVIAVVSIFSINAAWDDFLWPYLVLKDTSLHTVMVQIFTMKTTGYPADLHIIAIMFAIIPPCIIFMIFQKHIMEGFSLSGIKG